MNTQRAVLLGLCLLFTANMAQAQARLTVVNQSERQTIVKVVQSSGKDDTLHGAMSITPMGSQTMLFGETGDYFTKTMAVLDGRDPIYQEGQPFRVYVGTDGYSVIALTFVITESAVPQVTGGSRFLRRNVRRTHPRH
jgi:hypothetical protein